ncbi:MAG: hypothetical protein ACTSUE_25015 [Promethearchaeota archaeon]
MVDGSSKVHGKGQAVKRYFFPLLFVACVLLCNFLIANLSLMYESKVKDAMKGVELTVDVDFSTLNSSKWVVPSFQNESFAFEIEVGQESSPYYPNTTYSVEHYNMGTTDYFKANTTEWGEWGYAFHHLTHGEILYPPVPHYGGFPSPPRDKQEAYTYIRDYVVNRTTYLYNNTRPWISFNGHYPYHHYAAEFGFDKIGSEIGENMESYQMMMAFNRGAARQYQLPWFIDFSAWYGDGITDYNVPPFWPQYSGVNNGHSMELFRRSYYMAFMSGTSRLIAEGGAFNFFYQFKNVEPSGLMQLTTLGEIGRDFAHFAQAHPNRGVAYTPIAIYLDEFHGTTGLGEKLTFNSLPYNAGDWMTYKLLEIMYPGGWDNKAREKCQLVNNEYGDIFDIILQNASSEILASYPVIVMSGDIALNESERARLVDYVDGGGTLIANSAYTSQLNQELGARNSSTRLFVDYFHPVKVIPNDNGNGGNFILFGPDYSAFKMRYILRELMPLLKPFRITTLSDEPIEIQHMLNRNENGWVLTLINNDGITKTLHEAPVIDLGKKRNIRISLNHDFILSHMGGQNLARVEDWMANSTAWVPANGTFTWIDITLEPGDLAVLEFHFS